MYGMSAFGLARQLGIARGEAQDYIALYFSRYPGVRDFMERTRQQAREQGYVETVFGRRLYLENIDARNQGLRAGAERAAINAPMQGTAADIIKRAMIAIDALAGRRSATRALMVLQVHDELVFEVEDGFVDTLLAEVARRGCPRRRNCACRWWSTAASAPTGTKRTERRFSRRWKASPRFRAELRWRSADS